MLTDEQRKWLEHLTDTNHTAISAFNPHVIDVFRELEKELQTVVGEATPIILRGSSNLQIAGKGELDVYIPVPERELTLLVDKIAHVYGDPGSHYHNERARFNLKRNNMEIEVFVINRNSPSWKALNTFEEWLTTHPKDLKSYEDLKQSLEGVSTKVYYTKKLEFLNTILRKATKRK